MKLAVAASLLREALETRIPGSSATRHYLSGRSVRKGKSMTSVDTRCCILFTNGRFYAFGPKNPISLKLRTAAHDMPGAKGATSTSCMLKDRRHSDSRALQFLPW